MNRDGNLIVMHHTNERKTREHPQCSAVNSVYYVSFKKIMIEIILNRYNTGFIVLPM